MWNRAYPKNWGKLFERYCREHFPDEKEEICSRAERRYAELMKNYPDLGNSMMAETMNEWFVIVAFYEASGHRIDGEAFQTIHGWHIDSLRFLGKVIDANKNKMIYRLFGRIYGNYEKKLKAHRKKGEWQDAWSVRIYNKPEGFAFDLIGCPIAKHAAENGYEKLLPYLCRTDHVLAEVLHARLIRTKTEILGGDCCDYWYVGDKNPVLKEYEGLEKI